jgi:heat shock protein HtpX
MTNVLRTTVLLAALTALFLVIGGALGGNQGLFIAFVFALLMNFASYWFSDKIVLSMYRAREVTPQEAPDLYRLVQRLAQRAGIPMPRV